MPVVIEKIAVAVQLSPRVVDTICNTVDPKADREALMRHVLQSIAMDLAEGGLMVSPAGVRKIAAAIPEVDENAIVESVEKSASKREGRSVIQFDVDPSLVAGLDGHAKSRNMTVKRMVQEWMAYAIEQGWFAEMKVDLPKITLREEDYRSIMGVLGLDPAEDAMHGADIANWMQAAQRMIQAQRAEAAAQVPDGVKGNG